MILGPFNSAQPWPNSSLVFGKSRYKWAGHGPREPMPYKHERYTSDGAYNVLRAINATNFSHTASLYGKVYDKFWKSALVRANLGVTLLEGRKSLQMIAGAVKGLTGAISSLRRGNLVGVYRALKVSASSKGRIVRYRDGSVNMANSWLSFTFGWMPLLQDVYSACNVLQQDFASFKHTVQVKDTLYDSRPDPSVAGWSAVNEFSVYLGAHIRVDNPNLLLASQLGLTNPLYVLWDAVPFSFLADWFIPVGRFLKRLSNTHGLTVLRAFRGSLVKMSGVSYEYDEDRVLKRLVPIRGLYHERNLGMPTPTDFLSSIKLPKLDPWLAITSISLLIQQVVGRKS